ncbi:GNAT family N-acetyltransferase [Flavobacterium psychrophilum]|jgi:RimJ/RimL family protein N-acetyltransferase|uniref:GNAT family N-acetyltransferase n=1 Tax=Flavobacterium psychrophilum TaxID=96345 RepID=UPI000B7C4C71|nr:GNAT family N-acetyltransferase [Flavobacterium psychrophilum]SNB33843.1 Acetyltransferase, ribosomal protein N-acetylase [Flavobacterium psychrophilum]
MNWIKHPTILKGETVDLIPLEKEHFAKLYEVASDKKLWELIPIDCSKQESFNTAYNFAIAERAKGSQYPFVIVHKATNKIIGSTRLFEIFPNDKKLEIGWTWIIQKYWGTDVNFECKLLLLIYSFEILKTRRVQIKTDATNFRSRKAIEKIGGQFEGILRKDKIKENGISRNAAYYSIIDEEWNAVKQKIKDQLANKRTSNIQSNN